MSKHIKDRVRLAIIGAGGISAAHANGILVHRDKLECVALCDVSEENLKARSAQLGGVAAQFRDWKKMFADFSDRIDAVDICLPHHLHAAAILDAAAAGKHILCEKPMCISLAEADRIAAAIRKAGVTYMSAHNQLFMPVVQETKRLIETEAVGRVRWLRSQDCFMLGSALKDQWRAKAKLQGGGELIDTGYHPTYRLLHLAGAEVVGVRATMGRYVHEIEGEDSASVQVLFTNGVIGEILTSWVYDNPHGTHQIHVIGEKGQIFGSGSELCLLPRGFSEPAKRIMPSVDTFAEELKHFADCLLHGKRPIHSVEEGRAVLEIILKASENARGWEKYAPKKAG
ncbi:MAG: Gfo/Idh/MocA family oxidoreductase [Verrucomicrobia bacterium]|nr:Gfo/Idh/MocA family oxidoreductase [Verrucomicrobiota bacterium]